MENLYIGLGLGAIFLGGGIGLGAMFAGMALVKRWSKDDTE